MLLGFLISGIYIYKKFHILFNTKSTAKIVFAGVVIYFISSFWEISGLLLIAKYLALIAVYAAILFCVREFTERDKAVLQNMLGKGAGARIAQLQ